MLPDAIFVDEAIASLDAIDQGLAGAGSASDADGIHAMFRHAHSVKGGAAAFGLDGLAELMHLVESVLDASRASGAMPQGADAGLLREAVQAARLMLEADGNASQPLAQDLADRLRRRGGAPPPRPGGRLYRIAVQTGDADRVSAQVAGLFGDIAGLGELLSVDRRAGGAPVFVVRSGVADHELLDLLAMHVERHDVSIQAVAAGAAEPQPVAPDGQADRDRNGATVRVDAQALRRLVAQTRALAREGVATTAMAGSPADRWQREVQSIWRGLEDLGSAPVSVLFERIPAVLRQLSVQLDKPLELSVSGGDVRIDRGVAQGLLSPVLHLVRNACDHGIEPPERRRAAGKPLAGRIALSAWREAGQFRMSVRDDGAGLSRDKLLHAARARAIAVPADVQDEDIWALVFAPGLSTASAVSAISGRGVGMDVVKRQVEALGGQVKMASTPGNGVCVTISIAMDDAAQSANAG